MVHSLDLKHFGFHTNSETRIMDLSVTHNVDTVDDVNEDHTEDHLVMQRLNNCTEDRVQPVDEGFSRGNAPDGGWSWVVCFACFITHVIVDGLLNSFGVVFTELLDYFKGSKGETAVIAALSPGICFGIGPVVAIAVNKFGCRLVVVAGSVLSSSGYILSIFAPNIQYLYFSMGVMVGVGYGMIYLPALVSVSQYFDKHRALALGLGASGSGAGIFMFSPLTTLLIEKYTWQGAVLIHAAIGLNCVVCGLLFRPIEENRMKNHEKQRHRYKDGEVKTVVFDDTINIVTKSDNDTVNEFIPLKSDNSCVTKLDIDYHLSETRNNIKRQSILETRSSKTNTTLQELCQSIGSHFNISIYKDAAFCLYLVGMFFFSMGYFVPFVYLPDTARDLGIEDVKSSFLLSAMGISNLLGRIFFGYLSDLKWVNGRVLFASVITILGIATCLVPLLISFELLLPFSIVSGALSGAVIALSAVILPGIVGIDNVADALGARSLVVGAGVLTGAPLAGWLSDITRGYVVSYVTAGGLITVGGIITFCSICVKRKPGFTTNKQY